MSTAKTTSRSPRWPSVPETARADRRWWRPSARRRHAHQLPRRTSAWNSRGAWRHRKPACVARRGAAAVLIERIGGACPRGDRRLQLGFIEASTTLGDIGASPRCRARHSGRTAQADCGRCPRESRSRSSCETTYAGIPLPRGTVFHGKQEKAPACRLDRVGMLEVRMLAAVPQQLVASASGLRILPRAYREYE